MHGVAPPFKGFAPSITDGCAWTDRPSKFAVGTEMWFPAGCSRASAFAGSAALTLNSLICLPQMFTEDTLIDALQFSIVAPNVATSRVRVGVYETAARYFYPGRLMAQSESIDTAVAGVFQVAMPVRFVAGRTYWFGYCCAVASPNVSLMTIGAAAPYNGNQALSSASLSCTTIAALGGNIPFPTTFPINQAISYGSSIPMIAFRVAG